MHPSFAEDLVRERINDLWRLADNARREHRRELMARRPARIRPAIGRRLVSLGSRLTQAGRPAAAKNAAADCN